MKEAFIKLVKHPIKFRMFLFLKLPAAFFSGVRVREMTEERCVATVKYKWLTQNPFKSTYFASLAMAAELSTGTLALANIYKRTPAISMLVQKIEADFMKKATGKTHFVCEDGEAFTACINKAIATKEPQSIRATAKGFSETGEVLSVFYVTWTFKAKSQENRPS